MTKWTGEHPDPVFIRALLSPAARAHTAGPVFWAQVKTRFEGTVMVAAPGLQQEAARLIMTVNRLRPAELWLVYVTDDGWVRRLCVNHEHRPLTGTHKHKVEVNGGAGCYEPDDIPAIPLSPDVSPGAYRGVLEAFAAECSIQVRADMSWVPPWEVKV